MAGRALVVRLMSVAALLFCLSWAPTQVQGHGRLIQPPSRSSAWRYGFTTPPNYNDHELYCGGYSRQWSRNGGKCGPCGDPWDTPQPRLNEGGGKYGLGVIVEEWKEGQVVELGVQLTANHMGYFEFRLCPHNNPRYPVADECLDANVLKRADGSGHRYYPGPGAKKFYSNYRLPSDMTCKQCVLQWRYVCGNNWGTCENGTGMVGCGPQEEFRACADVKIKASDGTVDDKPSLIPEYPDIIKPESPDIINPESPDYNEVDVDTQKAATTTQKPTQMKGEPNHVGHIVALTLAFLLTLAVIFGFIIYFYWARDAVKGLVKHWKNSNAPQSISPSIIPPNKTSIMTISGPIGVPPPIPPRRQRSAGLPAEPMSPPPQPIRSISSPMSVTINGVQVPAGGTLSKKNPTVHSR
ncbi:unnamed protein product [Meganyctiphanes norvegica]|uniref:Chitin-binding type-4 domain-containing protein n=1 Tax=Meganyctiphanes norvegica TaxID=48144 RepID=A0AAV2QPB4_MEGNR